MGDRRQVRVLLVDPIDDDWELQSIALGLAGYQVLSRTDNPFKGAIDHQPDVILIDASPSRLGAGEVIERLKADDRTARIPVVALSSFSKAESPRADGFVSKPSEPLVLIKEIDRVLKGFETR